MSETATTRDKIEELDAVDYQKVANRVKSLPDGFRKEHGPDEVYAVALALMPGVFPMDAARVMDMDVGDVHRATLAYREEEPFE